MMKSCCGTGSWIDRLGFGAIALVGVGYIVFASTFAEVYLGLPFLDFPIFIGEILLAFCLVLLALKLIRREWRIGQERWVLGLYVAFLLGKAFFGYWKWGPIAFRDAALFYYPAFALFGYCFWTPAGWGRIARRIVFAVLLTVLTFRSYHFFWPFSLILLALVLARREEEGSVRFLFMAAVLFLAPYDALFMGVRTVVVSTLISTVFVFVVLALTIRIKRRLNFLWIALGLITILVFVAKTTRSGFWDRVNPQRILSGLRAPATVSNWDLPASKLYNPDRRPSVSTPDSVGGVPVPAPEVSVPKSAVTGTERCRTEKPLANHTSDVPGISRDRQIVHTRADVSVLRPVTDTAPAVVAVDAGCGGRRPLGVDMDNARFRLYIWRDMFIEYGKERPLLGFDFGYPLRSPSMKAYGISTAQDADGWLGAHNSFFSLIYRGGLVGLGVVGLILVIWGGLLRDMARLKAFEGVLLCAVLLNWMLAANFFLIMELPYTAIPFWFLFGVTAKYRSYLRKKSRKTPAPLPGRAA